MSDPLKELKTEVHRPRRNVNPNGIADTYVATCSKGHRVELDLDALSEVLSWRECIEVLDGDENCGASITLIEPEEIMMECRFCGYSDVIPWNEVDFTCGQCMGGPVSGAMQISGAYATRAEAATDFYEFEIDTGWERARPDYWECAIHFTSAECFAKVLNDGVLEARPTGFFKRPAICLTEVPPGWTHRITSKFGPFGFVYRKPDLLRLGGAPAINLPANLIKASPEIPERLKPFVNKAEPGGNFYFLDEREWRVPTDLSLASTKPMLVLPAQPLRELGAYMSPEQLAQACGTYGVLAHYLR